MRNISSPKIQAAAIAVLSLLCLTSCNADLSNPDLDGSASFTILDSYTGLPVDGVKVDFVGGASKRTSDNGQATFGSVRAGSYLVRVSKTGYETSQEPLTIGTTGSEKVAALNAVVTYRIHRQGPVIKGRVLLHPQVGPDTSATVGAAGVAVELRLTATGTGSGNTAYVTATRTATTNANGYYTFNNVPEVSSYSVAVPEFSRNGKLFSQAAANVGAGTLVGGQVFTHANIVLLPVTNGTLQVFARSTKLTANQGWVFEFSSAVDTSRFAAATSIQLRAGISNINSSQLWSQGFTVLSLTPATGTWQAATTYSVILSGVRDSTNRVLPNTTITATPTP